MPQQGTNSMHAGRSFSSRIFIKKDALWHSVLFASGCEKLLYPWRVSGRLVVMYHNVLPDDAAKVNVRQICQSDFRKQLLYLKKRYTVVSLSDFVLDGGINNRIAITLDDGLVNNPALCTSSAGRSSSACNRFCLHSTSNRSACSLA